MEDIKEYSVSEISFAVKRCVETNFGLIKVRGEIFGAKRADSGHWYLSLKDENAVLSAVCWKGVALSLNTKIEDGLEVIATGKITTFNLKSSYQLIIEKLEIAGTGALLRLLEERKQQYIKEGLFDAVHKKPLPFLPQVIGVVTSPTGAVIRDIICRVKDRFACRIIVWPTLVQGEGASLQIANAINGFNAVQKEDNIPKPDVLIVARGGGSLEDLWAFNEEEVIRAVYNSQIPIISAVGHETDTMLIDYVADVRAPTPTGAAEFAVPVKSELTTKLSSLELRRVNAFDRYMRILKEKIENLSLGIVNLKQILNQYEQRLDDKIERFKNSVQTYILFKKRDLSSVDLKPYYIRNLFEKKKLEHQNLSSRLESVSIENVLRRGFTWVTDRHFQTVYNATDAKKKGELNIRFVDGIVKTKIAELRDARQFDLFDE